jgi:hypothetical protein
VTDPGITKRLKIGKVEVEIEISQKDDLSSFRSNKVRSTSMRSAEYRELAR